MKFVEDKPESVAEISKAVANAAIAEMIEQIAPADAAGSGYDEYKSSGPASSGSAPAYEEFNSSKAPVAGPSSSNGGSGYDEYVSNAVADKSASAGYDEFTSTAAAPEIKMSYDEFTSCSAYAVTGSSKLSNAYSSYDDFVVGSSESSARISASDVQIQMSSEGDDKVDSMGPLSPDAGTAFSRVDPHARARNEEIRLATKRLVEVVLPAVALELSHLPVDELKGLHLSVFIHERGVNMRHIGYVRSCIPETADKSNQEARLLLLVEVIGRTLKNLLKDFQRRWMRSEKSTSEQGMLFLIAQFLNLVTGSHVNSSLFWSERVLVGITQRFGSCMWRQRSNVEQKSEGFFGDETGRAELERWRTSEAFMKVL